jgi:NAD(P)-dependent dehydrogenase (short-subunit alcohol dehydrogenase family)
MNAAQETLPVALITGSSSGIGQAAAQAFAERGIRVTGVARRWRSGGVLNPAILQLTGDVRDAKAMHAAVAETVRRFGRLDYVIANAGIGQRGSLVDSPWEDIEAVMRTNIAVMS